MPIRVRWKNIADNECTIRPTPLISISTNINKTGAGDALGVTYSITLTGTLLPDEGTPYALDTHGGVFPFYDSSVSPSFTGPYNSFDNDVSHYGSNRPAKQAVGENQAAHAILMKQRSLRALFADDGQRMEITDVEFDTASIVCFPRVLSIDFTEGIYITRCDYTITLEADTLWSMGAVDGEGNRDQGASTGNSMVELTEDDFLATSGNAYITDFNEEWSIETDEGQGEVVSLDDNTFIPRSYRITHNISATGKDHYKPDGAGSERMLAWIQAKKFVIQRLSSDPANNNDEYDNDLSLHGYPNNDPSNTITGKAYPALFGQIGAGTLDLIEQYNGFNHSRTENVNESAGSYSVTETWLMASGTAYETYSMSINSSNSDPFVAVSIDGNIKGLSVRPANDREYGGRNNDAGASGTQYNNALAHYNGISNNGSFGVGSMIYKRANNQTQVQLNAEPNSIALGVNEFAGELTYSLAFDNRPTNIISNTLGETININDTYPGDVFASIPVIGRPTGPVLQYIGGRTEYRRDISVNLVMDYTKIPYNNGRAALLLTKPSVSEPTATELANLLESLSPAGEPGVRKYFINAPSESWEPKTGSYSFNISFTYELDK
jgi:hypothetical protein